ncbi:MAG: hypothetical protein ACFB5Z_00095 [Elainellaceae cyanobacterium]
MNSPKDGFQSRSDGSAFVNDTEQTSDAQASDTSVRDSADVEMNQPSQTTSDMTVSKSVEVEQHLPDQARPDQARPDQARPDQDQARPTHLDQVQPAAPEAAVSAEADVSDDGSKSGADESGQDEASSGEATLRQVPIPPASEPLQYRAIGLIRGVYQPSEEQFTRGNIMAEDDTSIDAVLLGRVMSLVKKHVDLAQPHLWVVYPRTRPNNNDLHAQIVGIWEPESLRQDDDELDADDQDFDEQDFEAQAAYDQAFGEQDDLAQQDDDIDVEDSDLESSDLESSDLEGDRSASDTPEGDAPEGDAPDRQVAQASAAPEPGLSEADTAAEGAGDAATAEKVDAPEGVPEGAPEGDTESETEGKPSAKADLKTSSGATIRAIAPASKPTTPPQQTVSDADAPGPASADSLEDGYFSIRGEVVRQSRGGPDMTIKICQAPRKGDKRGRAFKLLLKGTVKRRAVGSFWDMHVQRQGNDLVIQEAIFIKDMPPTKRRGKGGPPRRGRSGGPPRRRNDRPAPAAPRQGSAPPRPTPKPVKRQSRSSTPAE